uniref:Uncharacterized protein n=1 Tax=Amphimedon queenslandica TaxID=400682 RepID=A0A1X7URQ5_AMPQE
MDSLVNDACHTTSPTLQISTGSKELGNLSSCRIRHTHNLRLLPEGGVTMVARSSTTMEWLLDQSPKTAPEDPDRGVYDWLGSILSGDKYRWSMVPGGRAISYQLSGVTGNIPCNPDLCRREQGTHSPDTDGQQVSNVLCQQERGTHSASLNQLAKRLWLWCIDRKISLVAEHIPGLQNQAADEESKKQPDRWDWKLNPMIFNRINQIWGPLTLDLFATRNTTQLEKFSA